MAKNPEKPDDSDEDAPKKPLSVKERQALLAQQSGGPMAGMMTPAQKAAEEAKKKQEAAAASRHKPAEVQSAEVQSQEPQSEVNFVAGGPPPPPPPPMPAKFVETKRVSSASSGETERAPVLKSQAKARAPDERVVKMQDELARKLAERKKNSDNSEDKGSGSPKFK